MNDAPDADPAIATQRELHRERRVDRPVAGAVTVSDPDNATWTGATVKIATGTFANDGDVLAADTTRHRHPRRATTPATETLTLSGTDTLADYQQVLRSPVSFVTASDNPDQLRRGADPHHHLGGQRRLGLEQSERPRRPTTAVSITAVNDPPTLRTAVASPARATPSTDHRRDGAVERAVGLHDPDNLKRSRPAYTVKMITGRHVRGRRRRARRSDPSRLRHLDLGEL